MENAASRQNHLPQVSHGGGDTEAHHAGVHSSHLPPTLQKAEPCVPRPLLWNLVRKLEWETEEDLGLVVKLIHEIK